MCIVIPCAVQVINAFLAALMAEQNKQLENHIYVFPTQLALMWDKTELAKSWMFKNVCV